MWKTQRHKRYGMTIDTNSYGKAKDTNSYGKKKSQIVMKYQGEPFGLPLPTRET